MSETSSLSRTLAGEASSVPQARSALRGFLDDSPRTDDAELIVSELVTNAVRHSASRDAGGLVELRMTAKPGWLRIEVTDQGEPTRSAPAGEPDEFLDASYHRESGRGLVLVEALSDKWGHEQYADRAVWWAELWTQDA